jgi:hypothetical protein
VVLLLQGTFFVGVYSSGNERDLSIIGIEESKTG